MAEKRIPIHAPLFHPEKHGTGARHDQYNEIDNFLDDMGEDDLAMQMPHVEDGLSGSVESDSVNGCAKLVCIMDLPYSLLSSLLESCGMWEPHGSFEQLVAKEREKRIIDHTEAMKKSHRTPPKSWKSPYYYFINSVLDQLVTSMPPPERSSYHASYMDRTRRDESAIVTHVNKVIEIIKKNHNAEGWEKMSKDERARFVSSAEHDQKRFDQEMAKYKNPTNDSYNDKLREYDWQVKSWRAHPSASTRPRSLVHAGMVCRAWRDIIRIGMDPKSTALTVLEALQRSVSLTDESIRDDLEGILKAMRFCIISEGKDKVFKVLMAQWVEKVGAETVRGELKEARSWDDTGAGYESLLELAATHGRAKITSLLIEAGAGEGIKAGAYNGENEGGERFGSPVLAACLGRTQNHLKVLKLLIAHGARVDPEEDDCYSYLHKAVEVNNFEAVKVLINAGAPINHYHPEWQDLETLTPLDLSGLVKMANWAKTEEEKQKWLKDGRRIKDLLIANGGYTTDLDSLLNRADEVSDLKANVESLNETVDNQKKKIAELEKKLRMERGASQQHKGGKRK